MEIYILWFQPVQLIIQNINNCKSFVKIFGLRTFEYLETVQKRSWYEYTKTRRSSVAKITKCKDKVSLQSSETSECI